MDKKLTQDQMKGLQKLQMKFEEFNAVEGAWIDSVLDENYPKIFTNLGNFAVHHRIKFLQYLLTKITKWTGYSIDVQRNPAIDPKRKGFRKGTMMYESIETVVKLKEKEIGRKKFELNIPVRGDLHKIMNQVMKSM